MALFDWIVVVVIGVSMVLGLWRGLVFEVITLAGWIVAFLCAQWLAAPVAAWLPIGAPDAPWRYGLGFVLVFIVAAFAGGLVAAMARKLVSAVGLRPIDRVLGALFGMARALLALLVVAVAVHLLSLGAEPWWRESTSAPWLEAALQSIKPALPEKLASYLS